ncbi:ribosome biogenesis protein UTP30 [Cryptococcus neoformans Bt15]|nr:ribosome biogenesis protein UTP30 [Cryptococcus neoformans var. grubii Bt15]
MAPPAALPATSKKAKKPQPAPKAPLPLPATFSTAQAEKAVKALLAHHAKVSKQKEEEQLLPREEHVWVVVNTKTGSTRRSLNPVKIQLPHPALPPPPTSSVCLFTKDPQRQYKDLLTQHNIKFISRVVGVEKLKGKFKPYEARRELLRDHDMFLCDERVLGMMPKLLGKMFFEAKKQPIPVNLQRKDLTSTLARAISSTYFHPTTGTSTSTRIATPSHSSPSQTLANLLEAVPQIVAEVDGGWEGVLSVGVKTSGSVMLPVWTGKLGGRFEKTEKSEKSANDGEEMEVEVEEKSETSVAPAPTVEKKEKKEKTAAAAVEKPKKKSSTIGSTAGGAAKRAKQVAVGAKKPAVKKSKSKL